jgi:hypothetical protein
VASTVVSPIVSGSGGENVAIEHNQIRALAGFEAAGDRLLLQRISRIDGIGVYCGHKRNALIEIEGRLAFAAGASGAGLKGEARES